MRAGRPAAGRRRSPPARERTVTASASSAARAIPAPMHHANSSDPCGNASAGSPCHATANGATAGACTMMRPRWKPISAPAWASRTRASAGASVSWSSIAARRAADGARSPCWRRNQRSRFRARCGARRQSAISAARSSVSPRSTSDSTASARIEPREIVVELRRLGLVRGGARERGRIAGKRRGEARRDVAPDEIALDAGVGIRLVVDPLEAARRARRRRSRRAAATRSGRSSAGPAAGDRCAGIAASPAGPAPRRSCSSSVSAWSSA